MSLAPSLHRTSSRERPHNARFPNTLPPSFRARTPNPALSDEAMSNGSHNHNPGEGGDTMAEEDPRAALFRDHYARTAARLLAVLGGGHKRKHSEMEDNQGEQPSDLAPKAHDARPQVTPKKAARTIDEDDYGDDDDEEEEEDDTRTSPLLSRSAPNGIAPTGLDKAASAYPNLRIPPFPHGKLANERTNTPSSEPARSSDEVRQKLQQDKKAVEDAAKRSFHTLFYSLENDRDAMLEQQKLDELDRQVETEMSGHTANAPASGAPAGPQQGTLSSANLGASSLTMKHLIARIDSKRDLVHASDAELRTLISEVRKNRSKWASEDQVGQEELYESIEKVLMELKAGEHAHPFLQRVSKRDAPDYNSVIKQPMDIGTMMKKLRGAHYKSKKEFVDDLMLIWSNCLKYNAAPDHPLRKKALYMRKETEKLVPLIPEITIRSRAEVEAEERRIARSGDADADGAEDSEDEEPIMASRGRKAPSKGSSGSSNARKAPPAGLEGTPGPETKPGIPLINNAVSNFKNDYLRADSEMEGSINGFSTPPPGTLTPLGANGISRSGAHGSQADISEVDGTSAFNLESEDADLDDLEYKTWKQVTKKDRATIAAERHRLFRDDRLNVEEPAILRSRAGMRRYLRHRKQALEEESLEGGAVEVEGKDEIQASAGETLAEGIEGEEERQIPDYYDPVCVVPDISERIQWVEDADGHAIQQVEENMRVVPKGQFTAPDSSLAKRMQGNMKQVQETRKICAKISIVKQMQLQSQIYQNQFQKYDPQPFVEADIEPMVVSEEGPIMAPYVVRAALQRSVGEIFYHAGFEEFQPSALEAVTDIAAQYFQNLARSLCVYREAPKMKSEVPVKTSNGTTNWIPRFTKEEATLNALNTNGEDLETLEAYVKDDIERFGSKLTGMHDRMRSYYADILRPALDGSAGADGAGAFNDGSEQFVGGDFAEDIGEDFFGFRELGLAKEFGLSFSVPLHLLQNRMHNHYAAQNTNTVTTTGLLMEEPPKFEPVTVKNVGNQIGLVQEWFMAKLHDNNNEPLVEDDDLPPKQRFPKPRLPPTGKISSPRKRPLREQQQMARKKRKMDEDKDDNAGNDGSFGANGGSTMKGLGNPIGKLKLMPSHKENQHVAEPEKDDGSAVGMISPESIGGS